jgi:phosphoglycerate dehydrogenase-like enzyme
MRRTRKRPKAAFIAPNVLITPHAAIHGTPYREKWEAMLIENCRRFAAGQPLLNPVDKENWF